jgi:hypothetical protein
MDLEQQITQLETAITIIKAQAAGNPVEWEVNDNETHPNDFIAFKTAADVPAFLTPPGRHTIRIKDFVPIPWSAEKQAHARGERIEFRPLHKGLDWINWSSGETPPWDDDDLEYRIAPEPVMVDLGPEDIEPGSALRRAGNCVSGRMIQSWGEWGVSTHDKKTITFAELRIGNWLIHRPSAPGVWSKCEKEGAK